MRFVLIHGGFHGAWCWTRVIPELEKLGHEAIAIDLPGHGERRDESSLLHERAGAIVEVMRDLGLEQKEFGEGVLPLLDEFMLSRGVSERAACLVAVTRIRHKYPEYKKGGA